MVVLLMEDEEDYHPKPGTNLRSGVGRWGGNHGGRGGGGAIGSGWGGERRQLIATLNPTTPGNTSPAQGPPTS